jgi:hypothetical protein
MTLASTVLILLSLVCLVYGGIGESMLYVQSLQHRRETLNNTAIMHRCVVFVESKKQPNQTNTLLVE